MGLFKKKKRILSEEQAKNFFQKGEKIAKRIKLKEKIEKINQFGNKKPHLAFAYLFIGLAILFLISFLYPKTGFSTPKALEVPKKQPVEVPADVKFQNEMRNIYQEMREITDTISAVFNKPTLTLEDSIFIIKKYERLEALDKVINEKYETE